VLLSILFISISKYIKFIILSDKLSNINTYIVLLYIYLVTRKYCFTFVLDCFFFSSIFNNFFRKIVQIEINMFS